MYKYKRYDMFTHNTGIGRADRQTDGRIC